MHKLIEWFLVNFCHAQVNQYPVPISLQLLLWAAAKPACLYNAISVPSMLSANPSASIFHVLQKIQNAYIVLSFLPACTTFYIYADLLVSTCIAFVKNSVHAGDGNAIRPCTNILPRARPMVRLIATVLAMVMLL